MEETIKKGIRYGLGAGTIVKEKAEELWEDMVKESESDVEEGKKLVNDLVDKMKAQNEELREKIETGIKDVIKSFPFVTKDDIESLREEIKEIKEA